ncbi:MAG: alpha/beta hydrolase [Pedosphaera sp.]|nr:alpha/beta hydrolase [Pedosphaera sp.]
MTILKTLPLILLFPAALLAGAEPKEVLLWPNGAPGSEGKPGREVVQIAGNGERNVWNIHNPSITPFIPSKDKATGTAVIIAPGGGHRLLCVDHEGYNAALWLSERGIAAFVLKNRLARETNSTYKIDVEALADTQRAIRLVRQRANEWNVNPKRVGVMGFSAGGELAALVSSKFDAGNESAPDVVDRQSCKPDFQALVYPGRSSDIRPTTNSPPVFLACGYNDRPDISRGLAEVYLRFKEAGVPADLHIYSTAGHGFGVRSNTKGAVAGWLARFEDWLGDRGFLNRPDASQSGP